MNEYEIYMMYLWDRLETLMKYENKKLNMELFNQTISDENFDVESVEVSISINKDYHKMYGRKMIDDLRWKYKKYLNGDYDRNKKMLYKKFKENYD
tara:strand:+ start:9441 stop:9728 length:288 start_codon:yes stop_codon:yes gene_type:complete